MSNEAVDRRNEELKPGSLYWVHNVVTNKGYTVYSKEILDAKIERGDIGVDEIVQLRKSAEF